MVFAEPAIHCKLNLNLVWTIRGFKNECDCSEKEFFSLSVERHHGNQIMFSGFGHIAQRDSYLGSVIRADCRRINRVGWDCQNIVLSQISRAPAQRFLDTSVLTRQPVEGET